MEKFSDDNFIESNLRPSFWEFKGKYDFTDDWFLMGSPYPLLVITGAYLLFVLKLGPEYMKNRRPFQLKNILLLYNVFQVALSALMLNLCLEVMWKIGPIHRTCMTDTKEEKYRLATLIYYYFGCKITELADTVLFVLRKKQNQVSFLHVYHHTMMAWNGWIFLKYEPGYWMLFVGTINCFVHTVMYTYYGLSAYPSLQKYLWWKKYITSLQLIQFALVLVHTTVNYFVNECRVSIYTLFYFYFNLMLFIYLFTSFYKESYSKGKKILNSVDGIPTTSINDKIYENGLQYSKKAGSNYRNSSSKKSAVK